jgi:hypothetical protein
MPATTLIFGVALGFLGTLDPRAAAALQPAPRAPPPGWGATAPSVALSAILVAGAALWAARGLTASYWRGRAERALASPDVRAGATEALPLLARARAVGADGTGFWIGLRTAQAALRLGDGPEAVRGAALALALEPWAPHAWALEAAGRLAGGDAPGAADDARRALALYADHPVARATLAAAAPPAALGRAEGP